MKKMEKKKPRAPRKSGSVAMAEAGLKQGVYWLTPDEADTLRQAAEFRGQSIMSLVQHLIRTGTQQMIEDQRRQKTA
jgi:hypothetical protein